MMIAAPPPQFDTFDKDIIIIPINHNNTHWCCAAVNIAEKRFEYYDSLGRPRDFVYKVRHSLGFPPLSRAPPDACTSSGSP